MSANTETTGADRAKCKPWCGMPYMDRQVPPGKIAFRLGTAESDEDIDEKAWCSHACRDARMPPIAAPAAHVERRKGQRWKFRNQHAAHFDATIVERKGLGWKVTDVVDHDGGGKSRAFSDVFWEEPNYYTMTLLADAPPEPAKHNDAIDAIRYALSSPPAQEAPKAAPVCGNNGCKTPTQNVAQRWCASTDGHPAELEWSCEPCHLLDEKEFAGLMTFESTGKPYAGPERLPRPRLAADWVEDCLPESDR